MTLVHILRDGTPLFPPFPAPKIPALLRARSVLPSDYFWHEGMPEWQPVSGRWTADEPPQLATPAEPPTTYAPAAVCHEPAKIARRNRPSLLQEAKLRYYESLAPWGGTVEANRSA
jgi:hypothetical protein